MSRPDSEWPRPQAARLEPPPATLTAAERAERGKGMRAKVPRESHAAFEPAADRPDPVTLLQQQAAQRLPELLPIRYGRMLASPYAFFRGAALLMAGDLAATPATGLIVQACGDAHLSNFGIFASPELRLVFDINDFDETLPGPWEWDVKRLAASAEVAARDSGVGRKQRREIVAGTVRRYRTAMRRLAGLGELDAWQSPAEIDRLRKRYLATLGRRGRRLADADLAGARDRAGLEALSRLTSDASGPPRFAVRPPGLVPVADLAEAAAQADLQEYLNEIITSYRRTLDRHRRVLVDRYRVADMARKVVGVGSVGLRSWVILLTGRDDQDRLFLQVKEAVPSALSRFCGPTPYPSQGERVVAGQQLMQAAGDAFLGWHRAWRAPDHRHRDHDYYIRQLRDWKFSVAVEEMDPASLRAYAELCAQTLARTHARTGDRIAIGAYLGKSPAFEEAVADFAAAYGDQNNRDHARLAAAVSSGTVPAAPGV
jgi:Uncharacterized protein conserved in bacteria (DUF2252)